MTTRSIERQSSSSGDERDREKQRLTVSFSNTANNTSLGLMDATNNFSTTTSPTTALTHTQNRTTTTTGETELLDVVLKNKKIKNNNRKSSITSNSSISSSMLNNKSPKSKQKQADATGNNQMANNSFDTNHISIKA